MFLVCFVSYSSSSSSSLLGASSRSVSALAESKLFALLHAPCDSFGRSFWTCFWALGDFGGQRSWHGVLVSKLVCGVLPVDVSSNCGGVSVLSRFFSVRSADCPDLQLLVLLVGLSV